MSTNKTENLNLHVWEPTDAVRLVEFNENFAALDAAVGAKPNIVLGSYAGSGAAERTINLGFRPRAVYVCRNDGLPANTRDATGIQYYGGLALDGSPALTITGSYKIVEITDDGFTVYNDGMMVGAGGKGQFANYSSLTYYYVALG